MSEFPEPLVAEDVDLRDFQFMPLDVVRLRDSDLAATPDGEVFRAAVLAWCVAWHQIPAASLPDDDAVLARLLGYGRDIRGWKKLRDAGALRGFEKCSDGRLYHSVVAEKANEAWKAKQAQRDRTEKARLARLSQRKENGDESSVTEDVTQSKGQGQGQGQRREKKKGASAPPSKLPLEPTFPPWWPEKVWKAYVEMRRKSRKPLTDLAIERAVREVSKLRDAGHDPGAIIEQSACKCWTDFYPPKGGDVVQKPAESIAPARNSDAWWEQKIDLFKTRGIWLSVDGPPPTDPDCNAPKHLLTKHGFGAQPSAIRKNEESREAPAE